MHLPAALALACLGLAFGGAVAAAPPIPPGPWAAAEGIAVRVVAADQTVFTSTPNQVAPPLTNSPRDPFLYPKDGSIVSTAWTSVAVSASAADGSAAAQTDVSKLSLFGGEITADEVRASVTSAGTFGDLSGSVVTNLVLLDVPAPDPSPGMRIPLGDWGFIAVLGQTAKQGQRRRPLGGGR